MAACGRQVTPNRPGQGTTGLPPGYMSVKFRTSAPFNFQSYSYAVVFNTTGNGYVPLPVGTQSNNYLGYSFAIIVGGVNGSVTSTAWSFNRNVPNQPPILQPIPTTPQDLQFTNNTNGLGTEFTLLFVPEALAAFYSTASPSPTTSPSGSPSPTPTPTPTTSPTGSPTASPTALPSGVAAVWLFNYFTVSGGIQAGSSLALVDSLGTGGPTDQTYTDPSTPIDITQVFDTGAFYSLAGNHPADPTAQIAGGDISNNP